MKKKILLTLVCLLLITGCKSVKLENGENAIVTFKEGGISSDDLYIKLKETHGAEKIMEMIDIYLLNPLYKTSKEETSYINQNVKSVKEAAEKMGADFNLYLNYYYGVANQEAFENYLSLNYKRDLWVDDYAKETVTDKQIGEYYENVAYGDIDASHILLTVNVKDDATDEEKTAAEEKVKETAKEIIKKLKAGEDFAKLAKEYSEDEETASNGGSLGKINDGDAADEVLSALQGMKDGSYSTSPVKSSYGYHILYRTSQDAKAELDDTYIDEIRTIIGKEIADEDSFYIKALKALREKNDMKFEDKDLQKDFESLMTRYEAQYNQK